VFTALAAAVGLMTWMKLSAMIMFFPGLNRGKHSKRDSAMTEEESGCGLQGSSGLLVGMNWPVPSHT